ncbi:CBS domain-containing protein [Bradyrhizobium sp. PUT101]|uniref:CBS domain-containing protein n=1 Tax=Bradyrhizobium sp. PUT101 TaxID=3447427 RepID=UPI003F84C6AB
MAIVVAVGPSATVRQVAQILLERRISAVPVVDADNKVLGIVSEGDLLHRAESGTERSPSWWLCLLTGFASSLAERTTIRVAAEAIPGAVAVNDHLLETRAFVY